MSWLDQLFSGGTSKQTLVAPGDAIPGRDAAVSVPASHLLLGTPLRGSGADAAPGIGEFGDGHRWIVLAGGCFWGVEEIFWQLPGVYTTAVGYAGGYTRNPSYEEVCTARTGHTEAVLVAYDPTQITLEVLLAIFWECHDPTQEMRQGNDIGTQYRSVIHCHGQDPLDAALASRELFAQALNRAGHGPISTEILDAPPFYYAEAEHQQYLDRNPYGYCGLRGTGVCLP